MQDVIDRKKKRGIKPEKIDFLGSYSVVVDTKYGIEELLQDIIQDHGRFHDEVHLAMNNNIKLIILVENKGGVISRTKYSNPTIRDLSELHSWKNPRLFIMQGGKQKYPRATRGITLQKACYTMEKKYGVKFLFCTPEESAKRIIEILNGGE